MHEVSADKLNLRRLPVFEPDPALWSRIATTHVRRRQRRQWGLAAAATVLLGVGTAVLLRPEPAPGPPWVKAQHESQALEAEWRKLADGGRASPVGLVRLRSIDAALQAAYDRDATSDEIAPLWQERNTALRGLITRFQETGSRDDALVTRI